MPGCELTGLADYILTGAAGMVLLELKKTLACR
jgi:hypothetical protein